jgi:glutathione S-transferase
MADVFTSFGATGMRLLAGFRVHHGGIQQNKTPEKLIELYEFEACPFCRKTREALTALDLDAMIYPCPKGGTRFRPSKKQFPYLVDPNNGTAMYESMDIARYLANEYADGSLPFGLSLGPLTTFSSMMASVWRSGHGGRVRPSKPPDKPLELWSMEGSPFCRLVRETLCELEIAYVLHNVGVGSRHRESFVARSGKMMVPYLADPNTGKEMFESADIVAYLNATYGR